MRVLRLRLRRLPLLLSILFILVCSARLYSQGTPTIDVTVTAAPTTVAARGTVTLTFAVSVSDPDHLAMTNPSGICTIPDYEDFDLDVTQGGSFLHGYTLTVASEEFEAPTTTGDVTVNCTISAQFGSQTFSGTNYVTVTVTSDCTAVEGEPENIGETDDSQATFTTTWSLPYTLNPGGAGTVQTKGDDMGDDTGQVDCQGDEITYPGDYQYSTVADGTTQPSQLTVTLNWSVTNYDGWTTGTTCCSSPSTTDPNGVDPSTVNPAPPTVVNFRYTAECSTGSGLLNTSKPILLAIAPPANKVVYRHCAVHHRSLFGPVFVTENF
jgi:hypothetical protein